MKYRLIGALLLSCFASNIWAYEGPKPLRDIKVNASIDSNSTGVFSFRYEILNPSTNDGSIYSVDLFLSQDPAVDSNTSSVSLKQCPHYGRQSSVNALKVRSGTSIGSSAPAGWDCGYGRLLGFTSISYGWGAEDDPYLIKPGGSRKGFSLTSYGLPAIRDILVEPNIELDQLPKEYEENVEKTVALEVKVRWLGKTIGPKAPPKVFVAADFLDYLISLKSQSVSLKWITDKELEKYLDKIFTRAKMKLGPCDQRELKEAIGELIEKAKGEDKRKGLSSEARALLLYNAKYFLAQLPNLSKADKKECKHDDDDHHDKHEDSDSKD